MKKRYLSVLLVVAMVLALLVPAASADVLPVVLDISQSSITLTSEGYILGDGELNHFTGPYHLMQSNPTPSANTLTVANGEQTITVIGTVNIDVSTQSGACAFAIMPKAKVNLILEQDMMLASGKYMAGLQIPTDAALTITATTETGALTARGGAYGAGIGGSDADGVEGCGNLTISGGIITVTGGTDAAGIGGDAHNTLQDNGHIFIEGGTITATGKGGAGIGGGGFSATSISSGLNPAPGTGDGGTIEITGSAVVTATSNISTHTYGGNSTDFYGAGIGGGARGNGTGTGGSILIHGNAVVYAYSSNDSDNNAAAIGGSSVNSDGSGTGKNGSIQIYDNAKVTAQAVGYGAAIGGGSHSAGTGENGLILIKDQAWVTATSESASSIGGGWNGKSAASTGRITIEGNPTVIATTTVNNGTAAIGGYSFLGTLNISGGTVTAMGGVVGLGGSYVGPSSGTINITGGSIYASGSSYGIGNAAKAYLTGGHIEAVSRSTSSTKTAIYAPIATNGSNGPWVVCDGAVNNYSEFISGVLFINGEGKIYPLDKSSTYTMTDSKTIEAGMTLTVANGQKLSIPKDATLTIDGTLIVEDGGAVVERGKLFTGEAGKVTGLEHDHTPVYVDETPATCCATGEIAHWHCTACAMNFSDEAATNELATVVENPNLENHDGETKLEGYVAATCQSGGYTGDLYCLGCNHLIKQGVDIAPTGHRYDETGLCTVCDTKVSTTAARFEANVIEAEGHEGETITVEIVMQNNPGVIAVGLDVGYDPEQLTLVGVKDAKLLNAPNMDESLKANPYRLYWCDSTAEANNTANGVIATLTFEVADGCTAEETWIELSYLANNVIDKDKQPVSFSLTNDSVKIVPCLLGDVNGDRSVDSIDVTTFGRNRGGWPEETILAKPADVDINGEVNGTDLALLTRFVANWDGVVLGKQPVVMANQLPGTDKPGTIALSDTEGAAGEQVTMVISMENNPGIVLANLQIEYDEALLDLVSVQDCKTLEGFNSPTESDAVPYRMLWDNCLQPDSSANGELAVLTFEILADAPMGETEVEITYAAGDVINYNLQPVAFETENGIIEIIPSDAVDMEADWNTDGDLAVTVTGKRETVSGLLYCAAYDGSGKMLNVVSEPMTLNKGEVMTKTFSFDGKPAKVKLFFLDADNGYIPLCQAEEQ